MVNFSILLLGGPTQDNDDLDRALARLPFNFTLHHAETRTRLVESLRHFTPDIILYHAWHREMSELEALGLTQRHAPAVPFIIVDGNLDERAVRKCKDAGAADVIAHGALIRLGPVIAETLHRRSRKAPGPTSPLDGETEILKVAAENITDLIAVLDTEGRRLYNSPSYAALFGSTEDLRGTDSFADIHPDDRERIREVFRRTVATGIGERSEYRFCLRDGSLRHIESQGNVIRGSDGTVTRVVVISRDITDRRKAEEILRRSDVRFRSLIENSTDGIVLIDADGAIRYTSPSTERILGYRSTDLEGTDCFTLLHPEDRERARECVRDLLTPPAGRSLSVQYRALHRNGTWRWVDATCRNLLHDPHVEAIVLNYRDTTEVREMLDALRTSDERNRVFAAEASDGVWRIELDQPVSTELPEEAQMACILAHAFVAQCSDVLAREYGYRRAEELQGRYLKDLLQAGGRNDLAHLRNFIRSGYRLLNAQSSHGDADGIMHHALFNIVGIVEDGTLVRAWGTHRDITEHKQVEGKAAMLAHALRSISEGVYLTDMAGRIVFVNRALLALYGYLEEELLGKPVGVLRDARASRDDEPAAAAALHTRGWQGELSHMRKDGAPLRVSLSASAVRSDAGEILALMGVVRDVTDRKRAEQLQDAVYRIAQAADAAPSLNDLYPAVHSIIQEVMSANNFYIALHDEAEDLMYFPYFVDEIDVPLPPMKPGKGLTAYVLRTGKSLLCTEKVWDDLVRTGEVELVGVPSPIWLGVPLIVASRTIGVMVVQHYADANAYGPIEQHMLEFVSSQVAKAIERKRSEEALRESEERFRRMFEDDLTGDFISTPDGRILACNPAFARIFGFASVDEALKSDCRMLHLTMADRGTVFDLVRQKGKLDYYEMELRRKDGHPIYVVANLIGTFDEHERLTSVKGYLFDNTERKRLEEQLLQSQKMEAVGQLASGIAHDFNNVMSVTLTAAQMIRQFPVDDETRRYAGMIEDATLRGAAIAKQLLQFSRAEASKLSPISLGHVVNEVKKILDHSLPKTIVIRLGINLKAGVIMGDEGQVHQLLLNLCINARDAMTSPGTKEGTGTLSISLESVPGGEIMRKFGSSEAEEYAVLRVSDTGTGISPEVQRRMFEPFFTTKGIGKGTGLGLSIVHGIVKSHRGRIDVESSPGRGTTFSVYFPIVAQQVSETAQSAAGPGLGRGETILVIEDEEILRMLLREMLVRSGYRVLEAKDGEEGVTIYRSEHSAIAAVISDMGLPILSGEQVFHELKVVDRHVRLIFSTGYIRDEKRQELLEAGARCFIHKPYRVDEMLRALRDVLDAP